MDKFLESPGVWQAICDYKKKDRTNCVSLRLKPHHSSAPEWAIWRQRGLTEPVLLLLCKVFTSSLQFLGKTAGGNGIPCRRMEEILF